MVKTLILGGAVYEKWTNPFNCLPAVSQRMEIVKNSDMPPDRDSPIAMQWSKPCCHVSQSEKTGVLLSLGYGMLEAAIHATEI